MLNSFFKGACALAAAVTMTTGAANATEHTILIVEGGYFPAVVYASEGDSLVFINESEASQVVTGADDAWTSGSISAEGSFSLEVTGETPATFSGSGDASGEIVFQ